MPKSGNNSSGEGIFKQPEKIDFVIEVLMLGLLAFMPLALGVVDAWSEQLFVTITAVMMFLLCLKFVMDKNLRPVWSWVYIPIMLFLAWAVIQLLPLPNSVVQVISPHTAHLKADLLGGLPNSERFLRYMSLSFYACATRHNLRLIITLASLFFVVINVYQREDQIKRLLSGISIIGVGVALLMIAQYLFGNGKIYWFIPTGQKVALSGPFVHHGHYGQFMNLSLGAALALLLVKLTEKFSRRSPSMRNITHLLSASDMRSIWYLWLAIILGATTVIISLTRAGAVCLLSAGVFTTLVLIFRRKVFPWAWVMPVLALGILIGVLYLGFEKVYSRLATLPESEHYQSRLNINQNILHIASDYPVWGVGLGAHEIIYPLYDEQTSINLSTHAENEYAQILEEMGVVGLLLMAIFLIFTVQAYYRCVRHYAPPINVAAYGLGFGLLAVMVHSAVDFGQHLPANAGLSVVFCGLLIKISHLNNEKPVAVIKSTQTSIIRVIILILVVQLWSWILIDANQNRQAVKHWDKAYQIEKQLRVNNWQGPQNYFDNLLAFSLAAVELQPYNVEYRYWYNVFRWQNLKQKDLTFAELDSFTREMAVDLRIGCLSCPTYGPAYCLLGQLEQSVLKLPIGADHIETGYRLAPNHPTVCLAAAVQDVKNNRLDESLEKFQRYVALKGDFYDVIESYVHQLEQPELAVKIAGDNPVRLKALAEELAPMSKYKNLSAELRSRAFDLLEHQCSQSEASASTLATLADYYFESHNHEPAITYYRKALVLDYEQTRWRLRLAQSLVENDQLEQARHEIKVCLRLQPNLPAAKKLLEEINLPPKSNVDKE